jgi:hypothetical protein
VRASPIRANLDERIREGLMPASTRSSSRRCAWGAFSLLLLTAPLSARAWQFVNVIDSTGPYFEFTSPGINSTGLVALRAKLDGNAGQAILSGGPLDLDVVASTAGPYSVFLTVTIGDDGTVLFNAELDAGGTGTFTGSDPATSTVASTQDGFLFVDLAAIDGNGNIVNSGGLDDGTRGIFFGMDALVDDDGAFDFFARPAINDTGLVAFRAVHDDGITTGVYTVSLLGGLPDTVAESDGALQAFGLKPAINDSGDVAFQASLSATPSVNGIYTGPNPVTDTVVDTSGPFDLLDDPAITENGTVIFWGALAASGGIFSGPDPIADKVIGSFDPLFGSQVANVTMRSEGYSNGRLAFSYTLTDGRSGVAIAFAPEPAGVASAVAACIALCVLRARRSIA